MEAKPSSSATLSASFTPAEALGGRGELLTDAQFDLFYARGFLSLDCVATAAEVADLRAIYARLFEERAGWRDGNYLDFGGPDDSVPRLPQILMPSLYEPALLSSRLHAKCHAMAKQLLGNAAEFNFDHVLTKPPHGGDPTPWHQGQGVLHPQDHPRDHHLLDPAAAGGP
jgi:hypothetical protein